MIRDDALSNVLYIDLTTKSRRTVKRPDLFDSRLGGAGAAIKLLDEECPKGCDPLSPDNPIILAVGALTSLYPMASKTVAMFKSPHTGNLGESHCGGRSAAAIRMAGYGAIVIKGASASPVYVAIHGGEVRFRDAGPLWGMRSNFTAGKIIRENEPGAGARTIMRIGRAGENLVSYANVTTETFRHFGRLGLGAVFGSKKLKALVVSGKRSIPIEDPKGYRAIYDDIYEAAVKTPVMKKYHDLGTAANIMPLNEIGGLPTRNLKSGKFGDAKSIGGEALAEGYLGKRLACAHCPVSCIHIAALREPYRDEAYFFKTSLIGYDYELIYSLGTMLGVGKPEDMLRLINEVELNGLDVMSAGVTMAWAAEAVEKKLIGEKETLGAKFVFGDAGGFADALKLIVDQPNDFYRAMARGAAECARIYGGADFALSFGGNEMPGYHTGPAAHIGYLIGARHSHLDNAGYAVDQSVLAAKMIPAEELVDKLVEEERWRQVLSSAVTCFFAGKIYNPDTVSKALVHAGFSFSPEELKNIGAAVYLDKFKFKFREGFSIDALKPPARIFETPSPIGPIDRNYIDQAIAHFKKIVSNEPH